MPKCRVGNCPNYVDEQGRLCAHCKGLSVSPLAGSLKPAMLPTPPFRRRSSASRIWERQRSRSDSRECEEPGAVDDLAAYQDLRDAISAGGSGVRSVSSAGARIRDALLARMGRRASEARSARIRAALIDRLAPPLAPAVPAAVPPDPVREQEEPAGLEDFRPELYGIQNMLRDAVPGPPLAPAAPAPAPPPPVIREREQPGGLEDAPAWIDDFRDRIEAAGFGAPAGPVIPPPAPVIGLQEEEQDPLLEDFIMHENLHGDPVREMRP
jgi:hypothetical protein